MKKSIKLISILMMAVMMIMVATPVFAGEEGEEVTAASGDAASIIDGVKDSISIEGDSEVQSKVGKIIGFLQWIGIVGGVAILAIFGIKYMLGSLEEKAEYKKTMIPYIVGAAVVMAAPSIAKLIFNMVS